MIPLRFTELQGADGVILFTADTGAAFLAGPSFLGRYIGRNMTGVDAAFLKKRGLWLDDENPPFANYLFKLAQRLHPRSTADYFILVPTLRCNLSCAYCQVSRADLSAKGFDWSEETLSAVIEFVVRASQDMVKLEFQGGEPTLRLDLVTAVIDALEAAGKTVQAVICTNLSVISPALRQLMDRGNVHISTSIDGSATRQAAQRMGSQEAAAAFFQNVDSLIATYGAEKVSALPTVDPEDPPSYDEIFDAFAGRGINSIFLRPINYQGFARKRYAESRAFRKAWSDYHRGFIGYLIARGGIENYRVSEFYFTQCLKRVFFASENSHVDLRNPNLLGADYFVIDHDGRLFPTDEARMLDRIGDIDLSIGDVRAGVDRAKRQALNETAFNNEDPDCIHCAYQPYCGGDAVDMISRYGRVDIPRHETAFCLSQTDMFEFIFSLLRKPDAATKSAIARWLDLPAPPPSFLSAHYD